MNKFQAIAQLSSSVVSDNGHRGRTPFICGGMTFSDGTCQHCGNKVAYNNLCQGQGGNLGCENCHPENWVPGRGEELYRETGLSLEPCQHCHPRLHQAADLLRHAEEKKSQQRRSLRQ